MRHPPLDFVAYLQARGYRAAADTVGALLDEVGRAAHTLELVIFLPLKSPEPSGGAGVERWVDRSLAAILRDDILALFGAVRPRLLELTGSPAVRPEALERAVGVQVR